MYGMDGAGQWARLHAKLVSIGDPPRMTPSGLWVFQQLVVYSVNGFQRAKTEAQKDLLEGDPLAVSISTAILTPERVRANTGVTAADYKLFLQALAYNDYIEVRNFDEEDLVITARADVSEFGQILSYRFLAEDAYAAQQKTKQEDNEND